MTLRLTADTRDALEIRIWAHQQARYWMTVLSCAIEEQGGQWVADMEFIE